MPETHAPSTPGTLPPAPGAPESSGAAPDGPDFFWTAPEEFRSLGLEYTDEEREEYLVRLMDVIWPGGTDEEHHRLSAWYREVAEAAAADGAVYTGICLLSTDDDRISTASLTVRCEPLEDDDAELAARGLVELLSLDEFQEVHRVEAEFGPAVLVISGFEVTPGGAPRDTTPVPSSAPVSPIVFARADVYCPLPAVSQLLVFSLTTPSLRELPWYVQRLSEIAHTVEIPERTPSAGTPGPGAEAAVPGTGTGSGPGRAPGSSPISAFAL
ncbi:hypothetical protein [Streptomyces barkulensis]|uniref:hypothetical protein n=1 Tax=Streptomyces barkulensis TaxID=1257026 RepID=UPI000C6CC484|nr:hypothetical protein [Streptomyces barkulensis]